MNFYPKPTKLVDCLIHGIDTSAELFLVEGDSASGAVARSRREEFQAVLPMQGKPINAIKASRASVLDNDLLAVLIETLGAGWDDRFDVDRLRFDKVILLFDPDADGIHCAALMMMFFYRWMPELIRSRRLWLVRPPLYEFVSQDLQETVHAYSDEHCRKMREVLQDKGIDFDLRRFRGLANLNPSTLVATCLDPETRREEPIELGDAQAAIKIFGGKAKVTSEAKNRPV